MKFVGRWLYATFALLFLLCVIAQFYFAGVAIFGEAYYWSQHVTLVHLFGFNLPVLMVFAAFAGRSRKWDYLHILSLFFLVFLMYFTANLGFEHSFIGALHPLVGVLIAVIAGSNLYRAITLALNREKRRQE
ncbi:DUF6220 domain-containing protein [Evansella halocellulosilytica]|uniref:DUF6220 domain-containing protein n=1 Tax=Evansella halocellulosilytica TaxID=2011013 RepID=UPI000BB8FD90|nr:DUF6220 domain-containing protein [Evansella halocellulosilytica]